jgi:uncharacterized damage-inducible protein DinB
VITPAYAQKMARYNRWQNGAIYAAAGTLTDAQRREHRGAFFGSIHATLNHLLWADQMWLSRFGASAPAKSADIRSSTSQFESWDDLKRERAAFDETIVSWADGLSAADLEGDLVWFSGAAGREMRMPRWITITQVFNHQTHHRGQVHCLLTGFGARTEPTDLPFMPA